MIPFMWLLRSSKISSFESQNMDYLGGAWDIIWEIAAGNLVGCWNVLKLDRGAVD